MNVGQARVQFFQVGAVLMAVALVAGCGSQYRPVATPTNGSGPASQPLSLAVVVSAPSATKGSDCPQCGIATIIDYSGDTKLAQATIGLEPIAFSIDEAGANGYSINSDGTLTNFPVSSTLTQTKNVTYSTPPNKAEIVNLFSPSSGLWAADLNGNFIDAFTGSPEKFQSSVPVTNTSATVVTTPVMVVGPGVVGQRDFAISQNISSPTGVECNVSPTTGPLGAVTGIEVANYTADTPIAVGKCPVYAIESADSRRLFVLNRGDDTISVIDTENDSLNSCTCPSTGCVNTENNQTYTCHPTLPLSTTAVTATGITPPNGTTGGTGMGTIAGPVYAEYNAATSQLWVANYDGSSVSIIDVSTDPIYGFDSATFGNTYTVAVGKNPASVTVLYDGSRGYTANQTDSTVSIVTLASHSIEKAALTVVGHPRTVVSTQNSEHAKVYAASPDSPYLNIINAETDTVDTTVLVEGNVVDVRVTSQSAVSGSGNNLNVSRAPGFGQPCNLPLSEFTPLSNSSTALANCRAQDTSLLK